MTQKAAPRIIECTENVNGKTYNWFRVIWFDNGKRKRTRCRTKARAEAKLRELTSKIESDEEARRRLRDKIGKKAEDLNPDALLDATSALNLLKGKVSLTETAKYWLKTNNPDGGKRTVKEVIQEYIAEAKSDDLRPASIQDMQNRLGRFEAAYGDRDIHMVTTYDANEWIRSKHVKKLDGSPVSPLTRRHYMTVAGGLFNYAIEQGYVTDNPFAKKSRRRRKRSGMADERMPGILTVAEVKAVMDAAEQHVSAMVPTMAIGFFAGVRTKELQQLDWRHVDLEARRITIPPEIAKKRSVRHIDISDNLYAWLLPYRSGSGCIAPDQKKWRGLFDLVREKAEVKKTWPQNAMRHCFATFHLLRTGDQNATALQLGHRDTDLLFRHYRGLATTEESEEFWGIVPKQQVNQEDNVVSFPKAG